MKVGDVVCLPCKQEIGLVTQIGNEVSVDMVYVHWTGGRFAGKTEWWCVELLEKI